MDRDAQLQQKVLNDDARERWQIYVVIKQMPTV